MNPYPALINALHDASRRLHSTTSLAIVEPSTLSLKDTTRPNYLYPSWRKIREADGTIIPDSHNDTSPCATKANIAIAGYARMHKIPFLGIGTGMHAAVEDFARNVCDIPHPVPAKKGFLSPMIQHRVRRNAEGEGGGAQEIYIPPSGLSTSNSGNYKAQAAFRAIYGEQAIVARERFESNGGDKRRIHPEYVNIMRTCGFDFFCQNEDGVRLDAFRYTSIKHPFYVGVGFPPEYSIRILRGSDVMFIYVRAVFEYELKKEEEQE
jgi:CTP synthase